MSNEIERFEAEEESVQRMERFQSLQAGAYWRALKDFPQEGISKGEVLLLQSIRWADDAPHTCIVRAHPDKIGRSYAIELQDGENTRVTYGKHGEHRFLVNDFLIGFEYEPDHERIRMEEIQQVQSHVGDLQAELIEAQRNPAILAKVVEDGIAQRRSEARRLAAPDASESENGEISGLPASPVPPSILLGSPSLSDVVHVGMTEQDVEGMRVIAEDQHEIATIKANWIRSKTAQIGEAVGRMTPYFEEQAAAALARTEDVRTHVDRLKRGIETLDLYVGKGVEHQTLRDGASAPEGEPLTLIQRKLYVDEELAVWTDIDEWFDFEDDDLFVKALQEHPGLVDQIFPAQRAVVAMATTRRNIRYADPWAAMVKGKINKQVFLLVRDGEKVHRVFSPVESHLGAHCLFPAQVDLQRIFKSWDGRTISLDDVAYTDHQSQFEAASLHYKRFLVLLCGLDHRENLFGNFYSGPKTLDFVSQEFQDRHMRFVFDYKGNNSIADYTPRLSVDEWVKDRNRYLGAGSRVMCDWQALMNPDTAPAAVVRVRTRDYGISQDVRYAPTTKFSVATVAKKGTSLTVEVEVNGYAYSVDRDRTFNCKVDISKYEEGYWEDTRLAYLCLDAVDPEDLRWYIQDRDSRYGQVRYIRFFKKALQYVEAERAAESDIRARMRQAMINGNVGSTETHEAVIDQAIQAWRAANRGRPFPSFVDNKAPREWKAILDQLFSLADGDTVRLDAIAAFVENNGMQPLRIAVSGKGRLVVYATPTEDEIDDRIEAHAWVHRIEVYFKGKDVVESLRTWTVLEEMNASETVLRVWPVQAEWMGRHSSFKDLHHKRKVIDLIANWRNHLDEWLTTDAATINSQYERWVAIRREIHRHSRMVANLMVHIPVGIAKREENEQIRMVVLLGKDPHAMLALRSNDEEFKQRVRQTYVRSFKNEKAGASRFDQAVKDGASWDLAEIPLPSVAEIEQMEDMRETNNLVNITDNAQARPLMSQRFAHHLERKGKHAATYFFGRDLVSDISNTLDDILELTIPEDHGIYTVSRITARLGNDRERTWIDIIPEHIVKTHNRNSFGPIWPSKEDIPEGWSVTSILSEAYSLSKAHDVAKGWLEPGERLSTDVEVPDIRTPEGVTRLWVLKE